MTNNLKRAIYLCANRQQFALTSLYTAHTAPQPSITLDFEAEAALTEARNCLTNLQSAIEEEPETPDSPDAPH